MASDDELSIELASMAAQHALLLRRIRERMQARKLTAAALSARINASPTYVSELLRGKLKDPGSSKLQAIAVVLECTVDYLKGSTNNPDLARPLQDQIFIEVIGYAETGVFRRVDPSGDLMSTRKTVSSDRSRDYPAAGHFALVVRDDSMNAAKYPLVPGVYALGVYINKNISLKDRRLYALRRVRDDFEEVIIRRAREFHDHWEFHAESTNPAYKNQKIVIPKRASRSEEIQTIVIGLIYAHKADYED